MNWAVGQLEVVLKHVGAKWNSQGMELRNLGATREKAPSQTDPGALQGQPHTECAGAIKSRSRQCMYNWGQIHFFN